jgi:hypothetical protein
MNPMSEHTKLFERAAARYEVPDLSTDALLRRRDRKQRNQRVAAGALGIAVFALAAVGFVRLLGAERGPVIGPAPTASPSAVTEPPAFTETFDSPLHGFSIGYPSGWRTRAATKPWGHGEVTFDAPDVDVIFHPTLRDDLYLAMVSEPLGRKSGLEWVQNLMPPSVGICTRAVGGGGGSTTLGLDGAVNGWIEHCGTPFGSDSVGIVATATRGYIINLHVGDERAERRLQASYDGVSIEGKGDTIRRRIVAVLRTVELRPEDALDALNPSESP